MRALIQRVKRCSVSVHGKQVSAIGPGILILVGIHRSDTDKEATRLAERCSSLRIFDDPDGKMNLSVLDVSGEAMVVSQFTLYGDTRKGNRPNYSDAASPEVAERLYEFFVGSLRGLMAPNRVAAGVFRAMMDVELVNDGPVTVLVETTKE